MGAPILIVAAASAVLSMLIVLFNKDDDKFEASLWTGAVSGAAAAFFMWLAIIIGLPTFAHWSDSGYTAGFYITLLVGLIGGAVGGYNTGYRSRNGKFWATTGVIGFLAFIRVFPIGFFQIGIGPNPCSVQNTQAALVQLLKFEDSGALPDVSDSSVEKVSDDRSLQLARNAQPQDLQLGEYLMVGNGYEQLINGKPMNVHPMRVKRATGSDSPDIAAYGRYGNQVPGFLVVDSSRTDGFAQWVGLPKGKEIKFIYGDAPWKEYNLDRYVYFNYTVTHGVRVEDLDGPEVDDDLNFWYVGTIMKPSQAGGARFYMPAGVITVNPNSGEILEYTLDEATSKLPWLDRVLPRTAADTLVKAYAKYQDNAAVCAVFTQSGQWEVDEEPIITTRDGEQVMQYFITTLNDDDPLIQEIVYVSPKNMTAVRFPGNGMLIIDKARVLVEKRANPNLKPELYSVIAKEPTHMWFGSQQFMVFVLERGTTFEGFGAIRSDLARKENDQYVILGGTIGELSRRANEQIARIKPGSLDNKPAESAFELRVTGFVDFISASYIDNGEMKVHFIVREVVKGHTTLYRFKANSRMLAEAFVAVGHTVTVTGQAVSEDTTVLVDVSTIVNQSYPPTDEPTIVEVTPTPAP